MLKRKLYIAVCIFSSLLISCSKETVNNEVNTNKETCMQFMEKAADLTCFRAALEKIDLAKDPQYLQNGPYTFFAPVDAAFKKAGLDAEAIRNYDREALKKIIYGHILSGRVGGGAAGGFYSIEARCLSKDYQPILTRSYHGLFLNGNGSMATADLGDGLVHKLDGVAFPGTDQLWDIIQLKPELSMFTALVEQASGHGIPSYYDFKKVLSTGDEQLGWFRSTVLIPTNSAYAALGYNDPADFDRFGVTEKIQMLALHITQGYSFTSDFIEKDWLTPGSDILKKGSSIIYPRLRETNIKASNGVAHIIDQVILP
jgi:uncharacterized surface protein with fasciclin (FAS1) repeats